MSHRSWASAGSNSFGPCNSRRNPLITWVAPRIQVSSLIFTFIKLLEISMSFINNQNTVYSIYFAFWSVCRYVLSDLIFIFLVVFLKILKSEVTYANCFKLQYLIYMLTQTWMSHVQTVVSLCSLNDFIFPLFLHFLTNFWGITVLSIYHS